MAKKLSNTLLNQILSGYIDLTKTGPLSYRELRNLNNNLPEESSANQALDFSGIQGFRQPGAYYTSEASDFGESMFDPLVASAAEYENYLDIRAENQPWYAKLGAGVGKAVTTAGTTLVDGTIGLIAGAAEGIGYTVGQWAKGEKADAAYGWSRLFDNPVSNTMRKVNDQMELILPNYRTQEEDLNEWYQNMGTANFWADFIKLIGFTVGAFYSGAAWTKGLKALGAISKAGSASMLGATLSAVNEGRIEANNNSNDWAKLEALKAHDNIITNLVNRGYSLDAAEDYWNNNNLNILHDIEHRKQLMGITDLAINVPLLMFDNIMTFGKLYARGFDSAKRASGQLVGKTYMQRLKEGFTEAAKKNADAEAGKLVLKDGSKYVWKDITAKQAALKGLGNFLREGNEEMALMFASEFSGNWISYDSPDAYYNALTDPNSVLKTKGFMSSIVEGFANSYGDLSKYQDFFMGGLTGLLGTPTFGKSLNSSSSTWLGRGKLVGISGGIFGEFSDRTKQNQVGRLAVSEMNDYVEKYNQGLANKVRHHVASNAFTEAMNGFAANGDSFDYHNMADNSDFNAIDAFAQVGKLDDYKLLVNLDFENISDEDLEKIATETIDQLTGKPLWANADGTLMSSTEQGRKQMREQLSEKRDNILHSIDKYEEYLGLMRSISNIENNDDAVRELAWLKWKINRFAERKDQLSDQSKDLLTKVNSSIESINLGLQTAINKYGETSDTNKEDAAALKATESQLNENKLLQKVILNWIGKNSGMHRLTDEGKRILLSEDFYNDLVSNTGMSYDEYLTAMTNILDLDRLDDLSKQFNDRLKYYLDNTESAKGTQQKVEPSAKESELLKSSNFDESTQLALPEPLDLTGTTIKGFAKPLSPINPTELKINETHAKRDLQVQQLENLNSASNLLLLVSNVTKASLYHDLTKTNKPQVEAIIKDLELKDPTHPAVLAAKIDRDLDNMADVAEAIENPNTKESLLDVWDYITLAADLVTSEEEFLDINSPIWSDEAINLALGGFDLSNVPEVTRPAMIASRQKLITATKQNISNLLNKVKENNTTASLIANNNNHTVDNTPIDSTGADNNTKNTPVNSELPKVVTNEEIYNSIQRAKQRGLGDNQILDGFKNSGLDMNQVQLQLDLYNSNQQPVTEQQAAVPHNYSDLDVADITTLNGDVTTLLPISNKLELDELPKVEGKNNYLRPNTTEIPIKAVPEEKNGAFNYDAWVDNQHWPAQLKLTLKVRHNRLVSSSAYNRVNLGELKDSKSKAPTEVKFMVLKEDNDAANDFIIYMTDDLGNIIGDLPTNVDLYLGLFELISSIKSRYEQAGSPDIYTDTLITHIDKIMLGRPEFTNTLLSIGEINPNLKIGICTNPTVGIIETAPKGSTEAIPYNQILIPLEPKAGLIYVLVPNGRRGGPLGYTPVLCTAPRVGTGIKGTIIAEKIKESLNELLLARTWGLLVTAIGHIDDYVYIPDIMINAFSNGHLVRPNSKEPITRLVLKDRIDGHLNPKSRLATLGTIDLDNPNGLVLLMNILSSYRQLGAPLNIRILNLNTPVGKELYNEVVKTNLPKGTETTLGNWFTTNPIINGLEQKAESPRSTLNNPNKVVKPTEEVVNPTYPIAGGGTVIVNSTNSSVILNGTKIEALEITDPQHLINTANFYLAFDFVLKNPNANKVDNTVLTPYGWYDLSSNKLVNEPQPKVIKGFKREINLPEPPIELSSTDLATNALARVQASKLLNKLDILDVSNTVDGGLEISIITGYDNKTLVVLFRRDGEWKAQLLVREGFNYNDFTQEEKNLYDAYTYIPKEVVEEGVNKYVPKDLQEYLNSQEYKDDEDALLEYLDLLQELGLSIDLRVQAMNQSHIGVAAKLRDKWGIYFFNEATGENNIISNSLNEVLKPQQTNPNILGTAEVNGIMTLIKKSDLRKALKFGFGTDLTVDSPIEDIVKAIEEYRDAVDSGSARETTNESYIKFDKDKELQWLSRVLPQLSNEDRVRLVDGLIDNRAWGMFSKGIMYLSDEAAEGTTYHEAFHAVSQTLLSDKERENLYNVARKIYGEKPIAQLEEDLAEDFRRYTLLNEEPDNRLRKFFTRIWNNIKALFNNKAKLEKLFYDINLGVYANRTLHILIMNNLNRLVNVTEEQLDSIANSAYVNKSYLNRNLALRAIINAENEATHRGNTKSGGLSGILYVRPEHNGTFTILVNHNNLQRFKDAINEYKERDEIIKLLQNTETQNLSNYMGLSFDRLSSEVQMHYLDNGIDEQYWNNYISEEEKKQAFKCLGV